MQIKEFVPLSLRESSALIRETITDIQEGIIPVYASIVGEIRATLDSCSLDVTACAGTGGAEGCCQVTVDNVSEATSEDAFASLSMPLAFSCLTACQRNLTQRAALLLRCVC